MDASGSTLLVPVRRKMGRPRKDIEMESVRLPTRIIKLAREVVYLRRIGNSKLTIGDYLTSILEPALQRDARNERKRFNEES